MSILNTMLTSDSPPHLTLLLGAVVEPQHVLAPRVRLLGAEDRLDGPVVLRQAGDGCQQPAVAQRASGEATKKALKSYLEALKSHSKALKSS